jgi:hypothetical protein
MALSLSSWATAASVGGPAPLAVELKSSTVTPEGYASNQTNPPPLPGALTPVTAKPTSTW